MLPTTAVELSLINDTEFVEELEQFQQLNNNADGFADLENGLSMDAGALQAAVPHHERPPIGSPYDADETDGPSLPAENRIPFILGVFVLIACLTAGAATAAALFHDRLAQITAVPPASR